MHLKIDPNIWKGKVKNRWENEVINDKQRQYYTNYNNDSVDLCINVEKGQKSEKGN